jgi:hypothetical protein
VFVAPVSLARLCQTYEAFYAKLHSGRRLTWLHEFTTCHMRTTFCPGPRQHEIIASAHQAAVLLLLGTLPRAAAVVSETAAAADDVTESIEVARVSTETGLDGGALDRTLVSLLRVGLVIVEGRAAPSGGGSSANVSATATTPATADGPAAGAASRDKGGKAKKKRPTKASARAPPAMTDRIALNLSFVDRNRLRLRIAPSVHIDAPREAKEAKRQVTDDRKIQVQAALVRVLKARRRVERGALIAEACEQLSRKFSVTGQLVAECIEILIEREYVALADPLREGVGSDGEGEDYNNGNVVGDDNADSTAVVYEYLA